MKILSPNLGYLCHRAAQVSKRNLIDVGDQASVNIFQEIYLFI